MKPRQAAVDARRHAIEVRMAADDVSDMQERVARLELRLQDSREATFWDDLQVEVGICRRELVRRMAHLGKLRASV